VTEGTITNDLWLQGVIILSLQCLELAAGISRVKGVKQLGSRAGNWLNRDQARFQSLLPLIGHDPKRRTPLLMGVLLPIIEMRDHQIWINLSKVRRARDVHRRAPDSDGRRIGQSVR
jgi:hypothetical protein